LFENALTFVFLPTFNKTRVRGGQLKKRNSTMHRRFGHGAMEVDATRFGDKSQFKPAFYRAAENCRQVY
jgi:hypothetical protein